MEKPFAEMTLDELENEESELRTELFNLRVQNTTKALENTARIKDTKKALARLLTIRRERQLSGNQEAAG